MLALHYGVVNFSGKVYLYIFGFHPFGTMLILTHVSYSNLIRYLREYKLVNSSDKPCWGFNKTPNLTLNFVNNLMILTQPYCAMKELINKTHLSSLHKNLRLCCISQKFRQLQSLICSSFQHFLLIQVVYKFPRAKSTPR